MRLEAERPQEAGVGVQVGVNTGPDEGPDGRAQVGENSFRNTQFFISCSESPQPGEALVPDLTTSTAVMYQGPSLPVGTVLSSRADAASCLLFLAPGLGSRTNCELMTQAVC